MAAQQELDRLPASLASLTSSAPSLASGSLLALGSSSAEFGVAGGPFSAPAVPAVLATDFLASAEDVSGAVSGARSAAAAGAAVSCRGGGLIRSSSTPAALLQACMSSVSADLLPIGPAAAAVITGEGAAAAAAAPLPCWDWLLASAPTICPTSSSLPPATAAPAQYLPRPTAQPLYAAAYDSLMIGADGSPTIGPYRPASSPHTRPFLATPPDVTYGQTSAPGGP